MVNMCTAGMWWIAVVAGGGGVCVCVCFKDDSSNTCHE